MSSQKTSHMVSFLKTVEQFNRNATLEPAKSFYWSPSNHTVYYAPDELTTPDGQWKLLHELAHARLNHQTYKTDFELLQLEVAAWQEAAAMAQRLDQQIDRNYIEDCLDTYRDWLHQRSTCPTCGSVGLQHTPKEYRCHNCLSIWHVSESRFCRPYRRKISGIQKKQPDSTKNQTTFR